MRNSLVSLLALALMFGTSAAESTDYTTSDISGSGLFASIAVGGSEVLNPTGGSLTDDQESAVINVVDFPFYCGANEMMIADITVASNGWLNMHPPAGDQGAPFSSSGASFLLGGGNPYPTIRVVASDLYRPGGGNIRYRDNGSNGSFTVSWEGVPFYFNQGAANAQVEVWYGAGTGAGGAARSAGDIEIRYGSVTDGTNANNFVSGIDRGDLSNYNRPVQAQFSAQGQTSASVFPATNTGTYFDICGAAAPAPAANPISIMALVLGLLVAMAVLGRRS